MYQLFSLMHLKWTTMVYNKAYPYYIGVHNLQRFKQNFLISKFIFKNFRYIFVTEIKNIY